MSLSAFISDHYEQIISEFAIFAKTLMPPSADMSDTELRDHAEDILTAVVHDTSIGQTSGEQSRKSQGRGSANTMQASEGFTPMIASNTDFRSGRCSRNFVRSARPYYDCTQKAARLTSPPWPDSMKPSTRRSPRRWIVSRFGPTSFAINLSVSSAMIYAPHRGYHRRRHAPGRARGQSAATQLGRDAHHEQRATHGANDR